MYNVCDCLLSYNQLCSQNLFCSFYDPFGIPDIQKIKEELEEQYQVSSPSLLLPLHAVSYNRSFICFNGKLVD